MNTSYEVLLWKEFELIAGIDEVGRGCLAGSVVAASVMFNRGFKPTGILKKVKDSKTLSKELREELSEAIKESAFSYAISEVSPEEIDKRNILHASILAMNASILKLSQMPELLLVDGNQFYTAYPVHFQTIVKGDSKVFSIAAASILAKVYRDNLMQEMSTLYPQYGFSKHVGYPTAEHINSIKQFGRCAIHRKSFKLKELGEKQSVANLL